MEKIKAFFSGLWAKIKADFANAMALIGMMLGSVMSHIDALASTLGDPNLTQQISSVVSDAKWIGRWMLTVSVIATVAKFKALVQSPPKD